MISVVSMPKHTYTYTYKADTPIHKNLHTYTRTCIHTISAPRNAIKSEAQAKPVYWAKHRQPVDLAKHDIHIG